MSNDNPYAAPHVGVVKKPPVVMHHGVQSGPNPIGLWRSGKLLVMHKRTTLPDRCVKSNEPANGFRLRRKLTWHHPAITLTFLISPVVYVVLALVLSKRATVEIGLSQSWRLRRTRAILIGWVVGLSGVAGMVVGVAFIDRFEGAVLGILASPLLMLGGLIYGSVAARMIHPQKITDDYVFLKGIHPSVLDEMPEWPYPA